MSPEKFTSKVLRYMPVFKITSELLTESAIPKKFWRLDINSYIGNRDAVLAVVKYIKQFDTAYQTGVGMFFTGHSQSCKTFLGTFVLKCLIARGRTVRYTTLADVVREYFGEGETNHTMRQLYNSADVVFVDDLIEVPNKGEISGLARLLQLRSTQGYPTLTASTLPLQGIAENYGDDVARHFGLMREISTDSQSVAFSVHRIQESRKRAIWGDSNA